MGHVISERCGSSERWEVGAGSNHQGSEREGLKTALGHSDIKRTRIGMLRRGTGQ